MPTMCIVAHLQNSDFVGVLRKIWHRGEKAPLYFLLLLSNKQRDKQTTDGEELRRLSISSKMMPLSGDALLLFFGSVYETISVIQ